MGSEDGPAAGEEIEGGSLEIVPPREYRHPVGRKVQDQDGGQEALTTEKHDLTQQDSPPDLPSASSPTLPACKMGGRTTLGGLQGPLLTQTHPTLYSSLLKSFTMAEDQGKVESKMKTVFQKKVA